MADLFVDTNVFLRYLTNDDAKKAQRAEALFQRAVEGKVTLETSLLVVAEMVWTLESFYRLSKDEIAEKIGRILNTPNLHCAEGTTVLEALDVYVTENVDFIDAYHGVSLRATDAPKVVTYDRKHFKRMDWLSIVEP